MSRGLGKTQRAILEHLKKNQDRWVRCNDLVYVIYPSAGITNKSTPELSSTYRAIRYLEAKGLVATMWRSYKNKQNKKIGCKFVTILSRKYF
jgi:hypothetical protein